MIDVNKKSILTESESENNYIENNLGSDFFNKQIRCGSLAIDNFSADSTKGTQFLVSYYDNLFKNRSHDLLPEVSIVPKLIMEGQDGMTREEFIK